MRGGLVRQTAQTCPAPVVVLPGATSDHRYRDARAQLDCPGAAVSPTTANRPATPDADPASSTTTAMRPATGGPAADRSPPFANGRPATLTCRVGSEGASEPSWSALSHHRQDRRSSRSALRSRRVRRTHDARCRSRVLCCAGDAVRANVRTVPACHCLLFLCPYLPRSTDEVEASLPAPAGRPGFSGAAAAERGHFSALFSPDRPSGDRRNEIADSGDWRRPVRTYDHRGGTPMRRVYSSASRGVLAPAKSGPTAPQDNRNACTGGPCGGWRISASACFPWRARP